jgi:hypothetical protein
MDNYAKLAAVLKSIVADTTAVPKLIRGRVQQVSKDDETCSVMVDQLLLSNVRLKAVISGDDDKLLVMPAPGSYVLLASLTGDLRDLAIVKVDQVAEVVYQQDDMKINIDSKVLAYENGDLKFTLDANDKKVAVQSGNVSLYSLFKDLYTLLKDFKVSTPSGPSGTPLPNTIMDLEDLKHNFEQLLK